MLLSIVMMIKNEERYLDNTLKSLDHLMKSIKSELIILDTGSTDNSIKIAKKYTEKVYSSKWNDNFAKMRNISIGYAKGDWMLILDADEELVNCEKLINFFKSGLHKKYNSASIELKNLMSEDGVCYNKASIVRLFKKDKNFRYEGAIHEQPIYIKPLFNDIAYFNHYGYMYEDEAIKQKKLNRNEKILLSELKQNPNNPYIYYQLAMNYSAFGDKKEALDYMEKCYEMYNKLGNIYTYVISGLAKLYIEIKEYEKCEKICKDYIKGDDKNIDISCYIAISQNNLKRYNESLENYSRYLYLLENYDISTQANDLYSICDTISFRENAKIDMINIYYNLGMYEKVIIESNNMKIEQLKQIYYILIMSLYKLEREDELFDIYEKISGSGSEKNLFINNLENMIIDIKQSDREKIYKVLAKINDNYGILNNVRLGLRLDVKEYNQIIIKEKEVYYSDLIYFAFKKGIDFINILEGISVSYIQKYFNYIVNYRRDCILDMYTYLTNVHNTLDLNKISIYRCLCKSLILNGKLKAEKYKKLFLMYRAYGYDYLMQLYNESLTDYDLINLLTDEDDIFIIKLNSVEKLKRTNQLEYIKNMKELLFTNKRYNTIISMLVEEFKSEFNQNQELENLKIQYKEIIKDDINKGNVIGAQEKINEYESMFKAEATLLNFKAIIKILNSEFKSADKLLKEAYIIDRNNFDIIFNISFVKETLGEISESVKYLNYIIKYCDDESIISEAKDKLSEFI